MGYNTKINLSNDKVCQNSGDILTLSGNTVIASSGDIRYASNPTFTGDTQIITKKYVDDSVNNLTGTTSQAITGATNGLTKDGQDVKLGGALDNDTTICTSDFGELTIQALNPANAKFRVYGGDSGDSEISAKVNDSTVCLTDSNLYLLGGNSEINMSDDIIVTDSGNGSGLQYASDYSENYTNRSLVDKEYVDIAITGGVSGITATAITGATNGLTKDGQDVCLGGTLDTATVFTKNGTGSLLKYAADYSSEYDAQTIPDAAYVTGLTSQSVITSSNGITKTGQNIELGGSTPLSKATNICGAGNNMNIGTAASKIGVLNLNANSIALLSTGSTEICPTGSLTLDGSSITVKEVANYDTDKSGSYTLRSIPDVNFVTGLTSSIETQVAEGITGATNGLTKTGQDVKLGGDLTETTTINADGNTFLIDSGVFGGFLLDNSTSSVVINTSLSEINLNGLTEIIDIHSNKYNGGYAQILLDGINNCVTMSGVTKLLTTPSTGVVSDAILVWNNTDKQIKQIDGGAVLTSAITGATNGLTKTGQDVCLGGSLITDTTINLNNGNCFRLCDTGNNADYIFDRDSLSLINNGSCLNISNTGDDYILTHCSGSNVNLSLSGLTYGGDYSANFKPNTLVTKDYVDNATGGIDANNGLTREGANIVLGGALTGDTDISGTNTLLISAPHEACDIQYFKFNNSPTISGHEEGRLFYDNCQLNFQREVSGVTTQLGEEQVVRVENVTGDLIPNGAVVYVDGASLTSGLPTIGLADNGDFIKATQTVGVATQDIANNSEGYVTVLGAVDNVDTNGYAVGSLIWLGTGGTFTDIRPDYPKFSVNVGIVEKAGTTDGQIYVRILYVPNYTEYGLFTGYTASTLTTLNNKLDTTVFNSYTGSTDGRLDAIEPITDVAITGVTNGLTKVGLHSACFGGTLANNTTLSGTRLLTLGDLNGICMSVANTNDIALNAKSNGAIYLKSQSGTVASSSDMTNAVGISMDYNASVGMLVTDNRPTPRGLQYADDYTSSFVDRSLVDKYYVDSIATGLNVHGSVVVATTPSGGNISLSGLTTVDGVSLSNGDRVLVKNQTNGALNGIYVASASTWSRSDDYNFEPSGEVSNGDLIPVISGTTNHNSQWILTTPNPITSGDTLTFSLFSQQQGIVEGEGICVETVGTNKQVRVKLSPTNSGLCFDTDALEVDYNIYTCGLDTSTAGEVRVCTTSNPIVGDEISVKVGTNNELVVDKNDFSYTTAANGLTKQDCNVVLGGQLTGNTTVGGNVCAYNLTFNDLNNFNLGFSDSGIITDYGISPSGLEYASDYSNTFTDCSLVSKYFVNNAITGSTLTYCNGITKTGKVIQWGGNLTSNKALLYGSTNFCVKSNGIDVISDCSCILTTPTNLNLRSCTTSTSCDASIGLTNTGTMSIVANNASTGLTITAPAVGAVYAGDYESNFVNRSLVTKQYVDNATGGIDASNGLTRLDGNITLGGILTGNTIISGGTYNLCLGESTSQLNTLFINSGALCANTNEFRFASERGTIYSDTCETRLASCADASNFSEICLDQQGIKVTVCGTDGHMFYADDYHSTYTPRAIPDVAYVTGLTSAIEASSITGATNGLTKVGQDVILGGALTGDTTIGDGSNNLYISTNNFNVGSGIANINTSSSCLNLNSSVGGAMCWSNFNGDYFRTTGSQLIYSGDGATFYFGSCGTVKGLYYGEDNTTGDTPDNRWLTDKGYVDNAITEGVSGITATAITGATNGLGTDGQDICLGGTLTKNTCINTNNQYGLAIGNGSQVTGKNSFALGYGYYGQVNVSGDNSFAIGYANYDPHSVSGNQSVLLGGSSNCVDSDNSGIIGGEANNLLSGNDCSVILGGNNINITSSSLPNHAIVPSLAIWDTPVDDNDGDILVWDSSTKKVGKITQSSLGYTFSNGITEDKGTVELGGTLTKNTCVCTNNQYGIAFGINAQATGANSLAIGSYNTVTGANSLVIGQHSEASGNGSFAMGNSSDVSTKNKASGDGSFAGGRSGCFNATEATGCGSFAFGYEVCSTANNSAILGGFRSCTSSNNSGIIGGSYNNLNSGNTCSVILGGNNINITSSSLPNHAIVPSLAIWDTPSAGSATTDAVLVWNSTDKKVKQVSAANLGEDNNIYDATIVTTDVTLTTGSTYVQLVNSPTSGVTITLPASPIDGQVFRIKDAAGTALDYNITIARNGKLIDGGTTDGVLNTDSGALEVVYNNTLGSWYVFSFVN